MQADLTLVLKDFKRPSSDAGGVAELAPMALDRGLLGKSASTVQDLSAIVLGRYLDKDDGIGVSKEWDTDSLPPAHAVYAAKDARVSLEIYEELLKLPVVPSRLLELDASLEGLRVVLLQADQTKPVARGVIELVPPAPTKATATRPASLALLHDGIKLTPSRVVLRVTEILVPGARASEYARDADSLEGGRALSDFPQPPFSMVVRHTSLRHDSPFGCRKRPVTSSQVSPRSRDGSTESSTLQPGSASGSCRSPMPSLPSSPCRRMSRLRSATLVSRQQAQQSTSIDSRPTATTSLPKRRIRATR